MQRLYNFMVADHKKFMQQQDTRLEQIATLLIDKQIACRHAWEQTELSALVKELVAVQYNDTAWLYHALPRYKANIIAAFIVPF